MAEPYEWHTYVDRHLLVETATGRIVAEIAASYPPGCYEVVGSGWRYASLDLARQAAHHRVLARDAALARNVGGAT